MVECDVHLSPQQVAALDRWGMNVLIHEFGRCLGLMHSPVFPTWDSSSKRHAFEVAVWPQEPKRSHGYDRNQELTNDDIVGTSAEWRTGTGGVRGEVTTGGAPAKFVRVFATRIAEGELGESVRVFTNEEGRFTVAGPAPGEYLLAAGTMVIGNAYGSLFDGGATLGGRALHLSDAGRRERGRGNDRAPDPAVRRAKGFVTGWRVRARLMPSTLAAGAAAPFAGCGGEDPVVAPAPPAPAPPRVSVSFRESRLEAREGETVRVAIDYEVRDPLPGASTEADYELVPEAVEIPAGQEGSGAAVFEATLIADALFAEGEEVLALQVLDDPGGNAASAGSVEITDAPTWPCPGIAI